MGRRALVMRLAAVALAFAACFVVVELASRLVLWLRTPPGMVFDDGLIYEFEPRSRPYEGMAPLNNIGCIGDDVGPRVAGELRIALLGGSTSFSEQYVDAVREYLVTHLRSAARVTVVSFGRPRYTSYTNRVVFERAVPSFDPDVAVVYLGINDNIYNTFPWVRDVPDVGYFDWRSTRSSVFWRLLTYHVVDKRLRARPAFGPDGLRSPQILRANVEAILREAWAADVRVVLSTFAVALPSADRALVERITASEPVMEHFWGKVDSTLLGVSAHNLVMEELAEAHGSPLARVAGVIPKDGRHFGDICHLTALGNRLLGETVAKAILASAGSGWIQRQEQRQSPATGAVTSGS